VDSGHAPAHSIVVEERITRNVAVPNRTLPKLLWPSRKPRMVPRFMLRGFWDELDRRGVSPSELERASGVSPPRRGDFLSVVSEQDMHRLFEVGAQLSGDATLGLSVGRAMGATSFHLIGHIVLASATLPQAIKFAARAEPHVGMRAPRIKELGEGLLGFGLFGEERSTSPGARVEAEMSAVLMHDVALYFLDSRFRKPSVHFAFAAPSDWSAYRITFPGELHFDAQGTFVSFPSKALRRRRSGADPTLLAQLFRLAEEQYAGADANEDWVSRVRRALRGHAAPRLVSADTLAEQFGVSARALSRRLAREGASLSGVMDDVLYERAQSLLRRPGATSARVAAALGYAELSSFFRAFRRWSGGLTPNAHRRRQRE
jgi:AraC-like DNA-binding protein